MRLNGIVEAAVVMDASYSPKGSRDCRVTGSPRLAAGAAWPCSRAWFTPSYAGGVMPSRFVPESAECLPPWGRDRSWVGPVPEPRPAVLLSPAEWRGRIVAVLLLARATAT